MSKLTLQELSKLPIYQLRRMLSRDNRLLSQKRLKDNCIYNPETGQFYAITGDLLDKTMKNGYVTVTIEKNTYLAHRLVWLYVYGKWPSKDIDHINRVRGDNRIGNLRDVSVAINLTNTRNTPIIDEKEKARLRKIGYFSAGKL